MVLSEDDLYQTHEELCKKLSLDSGTLHESWENFKNINRNYTLEGDPIHWIGCSVYVACRNKITPTINQHSVEGNCVNLTSLLRHCNLSLAQFFYYIKKWCDMSNVTDEFRKKIDELEITFAVTYNVFREYCPIFLKIFKSIEPLDYDITRQHRNRKQKPIPCTTAKIFEFCWLIFIINKRKDVMYCNNLVNSFHLLIALCDWIFKNVYLSDRRDLLNPQFEGLPPDWNSSNFVPEKAPCVINLLCTSDQIITDALYIKEYPFKTFIKDLYTKGILYCDEDYTGVFHQTNFEKNFKNITTAYESQLLNKGDFDERIFLAEYRRRLLEKEVQNQNQMPSASPNTGSGGSPRGYQFGMVAGQGCLTPLTGRKFLGPKDQNDVTPLLTATESISRLHTLLSGRHPGPSESLEQLFNLCAKNPKENIKAIIKKLGERFMNAIDLPNDKNDYMHRRLQFATTLFYKLIESILHNESNIRTDLSAIVEKDLFYECMYAASLEIVIYSYSSNEKFPWILEALQIQPYNFVKVIELIIRSKDQLSRDIIKHLNMIEEIILSSLVWKSESILWEAIQQSGQNIPRFEDTALPSHVSTNENVDGQLLKLIKTDPSQSPSPSATDRFQSPISHSNVVNRQLFTPSHPKHTHILIKDQQGVTKLIPIVDSSNKTPTPPPPPQSTTTTIAPSPPAQHLQTPKVELSTTTPKPKRTGGLSILFRKFYNLAGERLERLCTDLNILDVKRKIWTVFEESVCNHTHLFKDRDLDQLLMCAVYVICKLSENPNQRTFTVIMKSYREQPQANSDIYRNVLITTKYTETINDDIIEHSEERGDLIKFYNKIYVQEMKSFAFKFTNNNSNNNTNINGSQTSDILLSPLPATRRQYISPSIQFGNNIFVKPLESPTLNLASGKNYNYIFSRSPSKDLKDINKAIKCNGINGKRQLQLGEGDSDIPSSKRVARKVHSLIEERRSQNTE